MAEFEIMKEKLLPTGLYDISEGSFIYAELMAYAEGLDIFYNELNELLRECFVSTAKSYGLNIRENMLKRFNLDKTVEGRRNAIINALSVCQTDYTYAGIRKISDSFNVHGDFHAYTSPLKVTFDCTDNLTNTQKQKLEDQMKMFMPCWLPFELKIE